MICDRILPADLDRVWPLFSLSLHQHADLWQDWSTEDEFFQKCQTGMMALWYVSEPGGTIIMWFLTEVKDFCKKRAVNVVILFGKNFAKALPLIISCMRQYCFHVGARSLMAEGRKGLAKELAKHGMHTWFVTYELKMEH